MDKFYLDKTAKQHEKYMKKNWIAISSKRR